MSKLELRKIEDSEWKTEMEVLFEYDVAKQMVVNITWFYEDDGTIAIGTKWEHTYSGEKMDEGIRSDWDVDNAKWETALKWKYEYTGELVSKISEYRFVGAWELSQQYTYTYNTQGKETEELIEIWNRTKNSFENSNITTTTYHQNGEISEELTKAWDMDKQQWSEGNYYLYEFQYDANGNRIEYTSTIAIEFSGSLLVVKSKTQYKYDSNNYLIEDLGFTWEANTSEWIELSKSEFTNDNEGNPLVKIIYNKLFDNWDYSEKSIYNYDGTVSVESDELNIPESFSLSQNYPNPFNPTTTIEYSIAKGNENIRSVQLKVYDGLGKEIITLVNKNKSPGNYKVEFNASNLSSGIYYYTLSIGNKLFTKKCLLIK
jgi:hypothetical protein